MVPSADAVGGRGGYDIVELFLLYKSITYLTYCVLCEGLLRRSSYDALGLWQVQSNVAEDGRRRGTVQFVGCADLCAAVAVRDRRSDGSHDHGGGSLDCRGLVDGSAKFGGLARPRVCSGAADA
jgi:hypothetical protein